MAQDDAAQTAYVVRMSLGDGLVEYGLEANRIAMGYRGFLGLIEVASEAEDPRAIRDALQKVVKDWNNRVAGPKAVELWRFLRCMKQGDLVLVPHGGGIYFAQVEDVRPGYDPTMPGKDAGYYRDVKWLNPEAAFPRGGLPSAVYHAVGSGTRRTLREVKTLLPQVQALVEGRVDSQKTFQDDLRNRLEENAKDELENGKMSSKGFEYLLCELFKRRFGAIGDVRGGRADQGADIVLHIQPPFDLLASTVVIQAKYHKPTIGREAVKQIRAGMEAEEADLGLVITTGEFDEGAIEEANSEDHRDRVLLWDGQMLAKVIVESGLELTKA